MLYKARRDPERNNAWAVWYSREDRFLPTTDVVKDTIEALAVSLTKAQENHEEKLDYS